ncbi:MAG TPA: hypothetical protein VGW74_13115 [Propionibacteriaceae bacterium]|nr:hypothetical protein [Propionibacteriaceae bacterium]
MTASPPEHQPSAPAEPVRRVLDNWQHVREYIGHDYDGQPEQNPVAAIWDQAAEALAATDPGPVTFLGRPGTHLSNQAADELRKAGFPVLADHVVALDRSVNSGPAPTTDAEEASTS